jgi:hypothetical protein
MWNKLELNKKFADLPLGLLIICEGNYPTHKFCPEVIISKLRVGKLRIPQSSTGSKWHSRLTSSVIIVLTFFGELALGIYFPTEYLLECILLKRRDYASLFFLSMVS